MVFLKEFFKQVDFEKNRQTTIKKQTWKLPSLQRVKDWDYEYTVSQKNSNDQVILTSDIYNCITLFCNKFRKC